MVPVISVVGKSNSGKTTYLEKLIAELKRRSYKVAIVKHDVHGFEMDKPGKDTWRHSQAGADIVCISSPAKMAMIKKVEQEMTLDQVIEYLDGVDLILTEGYKRESKPKIEVYRREACEQPLCDKQELMALVSDVRLYEDVPHFGLDDAAGLVDYLENTVLKRQ